MYFSFFSIKITQRKRYKNTETGQNEREASVYGLDLTAENAPLAPRWTEKAHFQERQICMNKFFEDFGYMPLMTSQLRLDPTLYMMLVKIDQNEHFLIVFHNFISFVS